MAEAGLEQNMTAARTEHLVPGREIHLQGMRGYRFCEVALIDGASEGSASRTSGTPLVRATRRLSRSMHSMPTLSRAKTAPRPPGSTR